MHLPFLVKKGTNLMNFTYKLQVIQQVGDEQVLIWMYHV
jgi:hypothetical protein